MLIIPPGLRYRAESQMKGLQSFQCTLEVCVNRRGQVPPIPNLVHRLTCGGSEVISQISSETLLQTPLPAELGKTKENGPKEHLWISPRLLERKGPALTRWLWRSRELPSKHLLEGSSAMLHTNVCMCLCVCSTCVAYVHGCAYACMHVCVCAAR